MKYAFPELWWKMMQLEKGSGKCARLYLFHLLWKVERLKLYCCLSMWLCFQVFFSWILVRGHMMSFQSAVLLVWWFCPFYSTLVGWTSVWEGDEWLNYLPWHLFIWLGIWQWWFQRFSVALSLGCLECMLTFTSLCCCIKCDSLNIC